MKKTIITILSAFSLMAAGAQQKSEAIVVSAGQFRNIVLANDLEVVLMQAPGKASVQVAKEASDRLKLSMNGEALHIDASRKAGSFTLYLLVHELKELTLGGNTRVSTRGVLQTDQLQLFLEDNARAVLKTTGKVRAQPLGWNEISIAHRGPATLRP